MLYYFHSVVSTDRSQDADSVGGQIGGDKDCSISGGTSHGETQPQTVTATDRDRMAD